MDKGWLSPPRLIIFLVCLFSLIGIIGGQEALGADRRSFLQTVPTPTSEASGNTPRPPNPTSETGSPIATETTLPEGETTATPIELVQTPLGGYLATAEVCGEPPTVQALDLVNVRTGPSTEYEIVSQLVYLEVRPIIGMALSSNWWLIVLQDGQLGWVRNDTVAVSGNITVLRKVEPSSIHDAEPTASATWMPTPNPLCENLPTYTPIPTATNSDGEDEESETTEQLNTPTKIMADEKETAASMTPTDLPRSTPTSAASPTIVPTDTVGSQIEDGSASVPSQEPDDDSSSWLFFIGIGLVLLGGIVYLVRRVIS